MWRRLPCAPLPNIILAVRARRLGDAVADHQDSHRRRRRSALISLGWAAAVARMAGRSEAAAVRMGGCGIGVGQRQREAAADHQDGGVARRSEAAAVQMGGVADGQRSVGKVPLPTTKTAAGGKRQRCPA